MTIAARVLWVIGGFAIGGATSATMRGAWSSAAACVASALLTWWLAYDSERPT